MGVFSRFRRKAKGADEASAAADPGTGTVPAEPEAGTEAGAEAQAEAAVDGATPEENGQPEKAAAAEGVEIPKQQSVQEAADNEADEGARK